MKKMIDVSYHNGNIDFNKVKNGGIEGVIIRAGYGLNTVDKQFKNNIVKASAAGLHIGIYWFSYACNTTQALAETRMCLNTIAAYKKNIDLPIFFDWEYDSYKYATKRGFNPTKSNITVLCDVFCKEITNNGYVAGVYLNEDYRRSYINLDALKAYKLWYARYNYTGKLPIDPLMWQYSSKGKINGISGYVDMNEYFGDLAPVNFKSNQQIAIEVINGLWGNGITRKNKLKAAGYNYSAIQKIVNSILK